MTPNNNLSVLAWYNDISLQNHLKSYAFGNIYPLFTPDRTVLPFQLVRPHSTSTSFVIHLYDKNNIFVADITTPMIETGLQVIPFASLGYDVIVYPGILPMAINTPEGIYYVVLSDYVHWWYSELFTIVRNTSDLLKITWSDTVNMEYEGGQIVYSGIPFKNMVYLCTELGKPEYVFEEEGEKRDGYFFPEKQISEKTYKFTFLAPEYLIDALRIIRMSDNVTVEAKGQTYDCDTFLITPKWQTQGDIASVEAEFECATVIKKIGRGTIPNLKGDFNTDFNTDFKNNN